MPGYKQAIKKLIDNNNTSAIETVLRFNPGTSHADVAALQHILHALGYGSDMHWETFGADGYYGSGTSKAVRKFETDHALTGDGSGVPLATAEALFVALDAINLKLTDTIHPFATELIAPSVLPIHTAGSNSSAIVQINKGVATIYDDTNGNTISAPVWTYNGEYLGPTVIVSRDQILDVEWVNALTETDLLPCPAVVVDQASGIDGRIPQNLPGIEKPAEPSTGHQCHPRFSTHLHGGKIPPASDGWPESMSLPGQTSLKRYENKQRATLLWYHDHAMHTTRLHAYAGIAGAWIITDDEEAALNLPQNMLPLVIQDRNLSVSIDGSTGINAHLSPWDLQAGMLGEEIFNNTNVQFLHKVEGLDSTGTDVDHGPLEFAGPLTLVNGKIWPFTLVDAACYRLRILNGSNSRTYRLILAEKMPDGQFNPLSVDINSIVRQIGSDGGLLAAPVNLPADGLALAPAERADILLDFSALQGKEIVMLNAAEAPFANGIMDAIKRLNDPDFNPDMDKDRLPYPQVMMFKVAASSAPAPYDFAGLANRFNQLATLTGHAQTSFEKDTPHFDPANDKTRTIAIVEKATDAGAVLVLWELLTAAELNSSNPLLSPDKSVVIDGITYYPVAERFQDPVSYMVEYGSTERWRFINLTADTHPMHMHLVQFMPVSRSNMISIQAIASSQVIDTIISEWACSDAALVDQLDASLVAGHEIILSDYAAAGIGDLILALTGSLRTGYSITTGLPVNRADNALDDNEICFKDTIRVNPGEIVELDTRFDGYTGRYVYHCHLLEHEDHDMMRQFVVTRDDLNISTHMNMPVMSVGK